MNEFIGIDLGSNSLRAIKAIKHSNKLEVLGFFEKTVRTAEGLNESGKINNEAILRIITALKECKEILKISGKEEIIALSTQALRVASNSKEVLKNILEQTDIDFKVISGDMEAHLTLLGVSYALNLRLRADNALLPPKNTSFLAVDMGGASSEFVFFDSTNKKSQPRFLATSLPFGIVTTYEKFKKIQALEQSINEVLSPLLSFSKQAQAQGYQPKFLIANSGTPTTLLGIKEGIKIADYKPDLSNIQTLYKQEIPQILQSFSNLTLSQQESFVGKFKVDVIPFGAVLFYSFMDILGFNETLVVDCGIREGAILGRIAKII